MALLLSSSYPFVFCFFYGQKNVFFILNEVNFMDQATSFMSLSFSVFLSYEYASVCIHNLCMIFKPVGRKKHKDESGVGGTTSEA